MEDFADTFSKAYSSLKDGPKKLKFFQDAELKNGRLAMIGIISFATAVAVPGSVPFYPF